MKKVLSITLQQYLILKTQNSLRIMAVDCRLTLPGSAVVAQSAVNALVAGSNPAPGAIEFIYAFCYSRNSR